MNNDLQCFEFEMLDWFCFELDDFIECWLEESDCVLNNLSCFVSLFDSGFLVDLYLLYLDELENNFVFMDEFFEQCVLFLFDNFMKVEDYSVFFVRNYVI